MPSTGASTSTRSRRGAAVDDVEHARRESGIASDVADDRARPGRLLGGLQHHRVAGDQRGAQHVDRERDREVERREHREDAVRRQHVGVALALDEALKRPDVALVLLHEVGVGRDQVDRLLRPRGSTRCASCRSRGSPPPPTRAGARRSRPRPRASARSALSRAVQPRRGRLARRLDRGGHEFRSGVVGAARHGALGRRVEAAEGSPANSSSPPIRCGRGSLGV